MVLCRATLLHSPTKQKKPAGQVHLKDGKIVREEKGTRAARNSVDDDASTVPLSANVATEIRSPEFYQP